MIKATSFTRACLVVILCFQLSMRGFSQTPESSTNQIQVRLVSGKKFVDKSLKPTRVEFSIDLQTAGIAVSSLLLFYKGAQADRYSPRTCSLSADLSYQVDVPYSDEIDYYLVATPKVGSAIEFGHGKLQAANLPAWTDVRRPFHAVLLGGIASLSGFLAFGAAGSAAPPAGTSQSSTSSSSGNSHYSVKVGVPVGGAVALASFFLWKHHKAVKNRDISNHTADAK